MLLHGKLSGKTKALVDSIGCVLWGFLKIKLLSRNNVSLQHWKLLQTDGGMK